MHLTSFKGLYPHPPKLLKTTYKYNKGITITSANKVVDRAEIYDNGAVVPESERPIEKKKLYDDGTVITSTCGASFAKNKEIGTVKGEFIKLALFDNKPLRLIGSKLNESNAVRSVTNNEIGDLNPSKFTELAFSFYGKLKEAKKSNNLNNSNLYGIALSCLNEFK